MRLGGSILTRFLFITTEQCTINVMLLNSKWSNHTYFLRHFQFKAVLYSAQISQIFVANKVSNKVVIYMYVYVQ